MTKNFLWRAARKLGLAAVLVVAGGLAIQPAMADGWHGGGHPGHWGWRGGVRVWIVDPIPPAPVYAPAYVYPPPYYAPPPAPAYYAPPPVFFPAISLAFRIH